MVFNRLPNLSIRIIAFDMQFYLNLLKRKIQQEQSERLQHQRCKEKGQVVFYKKSPRKSDGFGLRKKTELQKHQNFATVLFT